jgi:hypothetical protein
VRNGLTHLLIGGFYESGFAGCADEPIDWAVAHIGTVSDVGQAAQLVERGCVVLRAEQTRT